MILFTSRTSEKTSWQMLNVSQFLLFVAEFYGDIAVEDRNFIISDFLVIWLDFLLSFLANLFKTSTPKLEESAFVGLTENISSYSPVRPVNMHYWCSSYVL